MKLLYWEQNHYSIELRTASLVKECYRLRCQGDALSPEKIHALCQLTWCGVHWQATKLPALWALLEKKGYPPEVENPNQLKTHGFPNAILKFAEPETGIVNFYRVYRNSSKIWIRNNFSKIAPLVHKAASLKSDFEASELAEAIDKLPRIPKPTSRSGKMSPSSLLTPLFACLDPRLRFPLVNRNEKVVLLHRKLGITSFSLYDQFNTLIRIIGQYGIRDALVLDAVSDRLSKMIKPKSKSTIASLKKGADRSLDQKDDSDVEVILHTSSRKAVRLNNSMTNRLLKLCRKHSLDVFEGNDPYRYDALISNYDHKGKDLLVEVKNCSDRSHLRLAVGQLLDYRRGLRRRAITDLAVLLPDKPSRDSLLFLSDICIYALWYNDSELKSIVGNIKALFAT